MTVLGIIIAILVLAYVVGGIIVAAKVYRDSIHSPAAIIGAALGWPFAAILSLFWYWSDHK